MKQFLVIGAGESAPYLIANLPDQAEREDWFVTVGDLSLDLARERIGDHRRDSALLLCEMGLDPGIDHMSAMSEAVGQPAAIAVKRILRDELPLTGSYIPTHPAIYEPVLQELRESGLSFRAKATPLL